jgi:hypothetical protein
VVAHGKSGQVQACVPRSVRHRSTSEVTSRPCRFGSDPIARVHAEHPEARSPGRLSGIRPPAFPENGSVFEDFGFTPTSAGVIAGDLAVLADDYAGRCISRELGERAKKYHDSVIAFPGVTVPPRVALREKPFHFDHRADVTAAIDAKRAPTTKTFKKGRKPWCDACRFLARGGRMVDRLANTPGYAGSRLSLNP